MGALRIIGNVITRAAGIAMIFYAVYYAINHTPTPIQAGVIHMPSFVFVAMGLAGITFASYQVEMIFGTLWNIFLLSPTLIRKQIHRMEGLLPNLAELYYDKGGTALADEAQNKRLHRLWHYIGAKLESRLPIHDIQLLIRNRGKNYNEGLFAQIRALQALATVAPAVGMTGTILGLIKLLKGLHDFESLGSNMALAFVTALYGLIFGNFVFIPLVNRLNAAREEAMQLLSQGLFWLDMVGQRKPADYVHKDEGRKIIT